MFQCLRALLIHKGTKPSATMGALTNGLRALLIHKGTKQPRKPERTERGLRALLIHKGTKRDYNKGKQSDV